MPASPAAVPLHQLLLPLLALASCAGEPKPQHDQLTPRAGQAVWDTTGAERWSQRALALLGQRLPSGGVTADRLLKHLTTAHSRALLGVKAARRLSPFPSEPAAVGGASATLLTSFFPLDGPAIEALLEADLAGLRGSEPRSALEAGMRIGRRAAEEVLGTLDPNRRG